MVYIFYGDNHRIRGILMDGIVMETKETLLLKGKNSLIFSFHYINAVS